MPEYLFVPPGATQLSAQAIGGGGAGKGSGSPGLGGYVSGSLNAPAGHLLRITVGCQGVHNSGGYGWARGGDGGSGFWPLGSSSSSAGGGGASAIEDLDNHAVLGPLMVGAGGGGGGMQGFSSLPDHAGGSGGDGGDPASGSGGTGSYAGGGAGGSFGSCHASGGLNGNGGGGGGGGGGAGYNPGGFGNGCGGSGGNVGGGGGGGGGGGRSYADPSFTSGVFAGQQTAPAVDGLVLVSYFDDGTIGSAFSSYDCTGAPQAYDVPAGATSLLVTAVGGAGSAGTGGAVAAAGGSGTILVPNGVTSLTVGVGCSGASGGHGTNSTADPGGIGGFGFAPGGKGGETDELSLGTGDFVGGGGGGGASGVGLANGTALLVAPGGGGGGAAGFHGSGGDGGVGGANGSAGTGLGAGNGGAAGANSSPSGGQGESGHTSSGGGGAGGGGGGYIGGAGGSSGNTGGGGGGGGGGGLSYNLSPYNLSDYYAHHDSNGYLSITPIYSNQAVVTLDGLTQQYTGSPLTATATVTPATCGPVTLTYIHNAVGVPAAQAVGSYGVQAALANPYCVIASGGSGILVVTPRFLTITAFDQTMVAGGGVPVFNANFSGLVPGEPSTVVSGLVCGALDGAGLPVSSDTGPGTYAITCSGGSAANYAISYLPGTLTITAAPSLQSVTITPDPATVTVGSTVTFTATGHYSDGSTRVPAALQSWTSAAPAIASVDPLTGAARGVAAGGPVTISAAYTDVHATGRTVVGTANLTVTAPAPTLLSVSVTPDPATVAVAGTVAFTVLGHYSDGSTGPVTGGRAWSAFDSAVAAIDVSSGVATGLAAGTTTIAVNVGKHGGFVDIVGTANLTVTAPAPTLTSLTVAPGSATVAAGRTVTFTATANYSDGSSQPLTTGVSWSSSAPATAVVDAISGVATGLVAGGAVTITAQIGSVTGTSALTVTGPLLTGLTVTPAAQTVAKGAPVLFVATGTYSDGTTRTLTDSATWSSADAAIATVSAGTATGVNQGTTTITASSGGFSSGATLTVGAATLTSLSITPAPVALAKGTTRQLVLTGTYTDGTTADLTATANWSSSNDSVATVAISPNGGLVTAVAPGSATVTATAMGAKAAAAVTVTAATIKSIAIRPLNPTVAAGLGRQFSATGTFSDGTTQDITTVVTWTAASRNVASFSTVTRGLATGLHPGSTTVTATWSGVSGRTTLTVTAAVLTTIRIVPDNLSIAKGLRVGYAVVGVYSDGTTRDVTRGATLSSSNSGVVTFTGNGAVTRSVGTATITGTYQGLTATTKLTVTPAVVRCLHLDPQILVMSTGGSRQYRLIATYTDETTADLTASASWTSSAPAVVTVSATGLATALTKGKATVTARSSGSTLTSTVTVR